jgi:hypothetical protein
VNTFTFNGSLMKNIKNRNTFITATIVDRRAVVQPDNTVKTLLTCARNVTIYDPSVVEFVKKNLLTSTETEFMVDASGYLSSSLSRKDNKWYDNQIITELSLAE